MKLKKLEKILQILDKTEMDSHEKTDMLVAAILFLANKDGNHADCLISKSIAKLLRFPEKNDEDIRLKLARFVCLFTTEGLEIYVNGLLMFCKMHEDSCSLSESMGQILDAVFTYIKETKTKVNNLQVMTVHKNSSEVRH